MDANRLWLCANVIVPGGITPMWKDSSSSCCSPTIATQLYSPPASIPVRHTSSTDLTSITPLLSSITVRWVWVGSTAPLCCHMMVVASEAELLLTAITHGKKRVCPMLATMSSGQITRRAEPTKRACSYRWACNSYIELEPPNIIHFRTSRFLWFNVATMGRVIIRDLLYWEVFFLYFVCSFFHCRQLGLGKARGSTIASYCIRLLLCGDFYLVVSANRRKLSEAARMPI